jgi:hypothetical protein
MLGFGLGLLSFSRPIGAGLSWAAFGWWAISGIIAAFAGGWVAGAFAPTEDQRLKGAGALAAWAVATLIVVGAAGLAAGTTATVIGSLAGPTVAMGMQLQDQQQGTVGQAPDQMTESVQTQMATGMLASFVALLIGAGTAFAGGAMAGTMPGRAKRSAA